MTVPAAHAAARGKTTHERTLVRTVGAAKGRTTRFQVVAEALAGQRQTGSFIVERRPRFPPTKALVLNIQQNLLNQKSPLWLHSAQMIPVGTFQWSLEP